MYKTHIPLQTSKRTEGITSMRLTGKVVSTVMQSQVYQIQKLFFSNKSQALQLLYLTSI